jgi:hypothetical protein
MAAKKVAKKKSSKKKAAAKKRTKPTTHVWCIDQYGNYDPLEDIQSGDRIKIEVPDGLDFDITTTISVSPSGGGGGPVTIHS